MKHSEDFNTDYLELALSCEPKVIGVTDGLQQVNLYVEKIDKHVYREMSNDLMELRPTADHELGGKNYSFVFKMRKKAIATDFMTFAPYMHNCLFLIKNSFLTILKSLNLPPYWSYPAIVYSNDGNDRDESYSTLFMYPLSYDNYDFKLTQFVKPVIVKSTNEKTYSFNNEEEWRNFLNNNYIVPKKITLSDKFVYNYDLINIGMAGIFVSWSLKEMLDELNLTGIEYKYNVSVQLSSHRGQS